MLKKTVTYTDFSDVERTEDFYFHLSKSEIMDMEFSTVGTFTSFVNTVIKSKDMPSLMKLFKEFILKAYGEKSPDGRRFIKSKEISEAFSQTAAFDIIYMEMLSDDKAAADFIQGCFPAELIKEANNKGIDLNGDPSKLLEEANKLAETSNNR